MKNRINSTVIALWALPLAAIAVPGSKAQAQTITTSTVRFIIVDPVTDVPLPAGDVVVCEVGADGKEIGQHAPITLHADTLSPDRTGLLDVVRWTTALTDAQSSAVRSLRPAIVRVPRGGSILVKVAVQAASQVSPAHPPVKDIFIKVTAPRLDARPPVTTAGTLRSSNELKTFVNKTSSDARSLTQGQSGVASDSSGQQHIRGEHAEITFVVDGIPLPDTLSGRQGAIVVPSTIENLDILTGGFAPEFGGQTAAILNVNTVPGAKKNEVDLTVQGGSYGSLNTDITVSGPIGTRGSFVFDVGTNQSANALEPQQPDNQTAHNAGDDQSYFGKIRLFPSRRDTVTLTLSHAPGSLELSNRTGLGPRFAAAGQGYGFLGQRDANGTRPDATADTANLLGAAPLLLPSQQADGMDISQTELNEFVTLSWRRQLTARDVGLFSATVLHSEQSLSNQNPAVNLDSLPVDNSIEYNPTSDRNVYHVQLTADVSARRGAHQYKTGVLDDEQHGKESYQIIPASQLSLDALAALSPNLAPTGTSSLDAQGSPVVDINGNPVFALASGATAPTLRVNRKGFYRAAFAQDTWKVTDRLTANYGLRFDWYEQKQDLGQPVVDKTYLSPRINLSYALAPLTPLRLSFDRLFNTPPLAQGAVVGAPIQPETLDQYDVSIERQIVPGQTAKVAYYYKEIRNQVDTGLLIPGSQIGLFSAVNFQYGGIHGIEVSYDLSPLHEIGWDSFVNYTYGLAQPNGLDNTGAPAPQFNDHDQRHTVGAGLAYTWPSQAAAAMTFNYGSGLASSPIAPDINKRIPRTEVGLRLSSSPHLIYGHGGIGLDVTNLFDSREVINFESGFSGTRFQEGRRILLSVFEKF